MSKPHKLMQSCMAGVVTTMFVWQMPAAAQDTFKDARAAAEGQLARDLSVAQKPVFEIVQLQGSRRIGIDAWVDSADLTYRVGQPLRISVKPRQDAYITVVDVGSSGRVALLYPNHFQQGGRVRAGTTVTIPSGKAPWQIRGGGPAGVDLIQVIASRRPLTLAELGQLVQTSPASPTIVLGRSAEDVARDLSLQLKPAAAGAPRQDFGIRNLLIRVVAEGADAPAPVIFPVPPAGHAPAAVAAADSPFGLSVRPARSVYRIGDKVHIVVSSRKDCRLTLIDVGTSGEVVRLYPNAYQRDTLIRADQPVVIPAPQASFSLVARGPAGAEGIVALCRAPDSPEPEAATDPAGFAVLGPIRAVGRDLFVTGEQGGSSSKVEQAATSYLVVE